IFSNQEIPTEVYQQVGTLLFTKKDKHLEELLKIGLKRREDAPEIGELIILNTEEIRNYIPIYSKNKRALFASGGARVDGKALIESVLAAAVKQGAQVVRSAEHTSELQS